MEMNKEEVINVGCSRVASCSVFKRTVQMLPSRIRGSAAEVEGTLSSRWRDLCRSWLRCSALLIPGKGVVFRCACSMCLFLWPAGRPADTGRGQVVYLHVTSCIHLPAEICALQQAGRLGRDSRDEMMVWQVSASASCLHFQSVPTGFVCCAWHLYLFCMVTHIEIDRH